MREDIKQYVIDSFSTDNSIKKYTADVKNGLWKSEEILIDKYFTKGSYILDLGCGVGRTTIPLYNKGYKVLGIDLTPKFIELAQSSTQENLHFEVGDATSLKYKDNTFDNVLFSFNGWSMIPTKEMRIEAAKEIYRVLKPNGYYIFSFHKRSIVGQELLWLIQLIKIKLLKPLGYKTKETDFGDFYFTKDSETTYPIAQFVSFLSPKEVQNIYTSIGFEIELMKMRSELCSEDNTLPSGDVMFFVCKKI